jgi:hypothetical protein
MLSLGLVEHWIPDRENEACCNIYMSDLTLATKLIIIIQNQVNALQNCRFPFYTTGRIQAWRLE